MCCWRSDTMKKFFLRLVSSVAGFRFPLLVFQFNQYRFLIKRRRHFAFHSKVFPENILKGFAVAIESQQVVQIVLYNETKRIPLKFYVSLTKFRKYTKTKRSYKNIHVYLYSNLCTLSRKLNSIPQIHIHNLYDQHPVRSLWLVFILLLLYG
jgi:hypothetical protein